jgi:hypothetical protein
MDAKLVCQTVGVALSITFLPSLSMVGNEILLEMLAFKLNNMEPSVETGRRRDRGICQRRILLGESEVKVWVTAIENFWLVTHVSNDYVHASSFIRKDSSFIKKIFYQVWQFTGHVHRRLVSEICSEKNNVIHQRKRGWMTIRWSKW